MKQKPPNSRPTEVAGVSYAPPLLAAGLMLMVWGAVVHWWIALCGIVLGGAALYRWILELKTGEAK